MRLLIRTRGAKNGACNICGDVGKLTEDHSPPKCCVKPTAVKIRHIIDMLAEEKIPEKGRISQNGVKFRTLCKRCNNHLLGAEYDPALAELTNQCDNLLNSSLHLPKVMMVSCNPRLVARSVFGHLAAQGVDRYSDNEAWLELKIWFNDPQVDLPERIRIYYWLFPHRGCVVLRDAALMDLRNRMPASIWLLKFYPLSFMFSWEKTPRKMFDLPMLPVNSTEATVDIPVQLRQIPHRYWPEAPTDETIVAYGQEAMFSVNYDPGNK